MVKAQKGIINRLLGLVAPAMLAFGLSLLPMLAPAASATAGINNSLNYQGRLLTSSGAIAPDGFYNIEFKIYQDGTGCVTSGTSPCGGTLKYTEDWVYGTGSPDNRVKVTNGYFSVQIGTINTTLASAVDWNQNTLWMSVNIGNTSTAANFGAASGDGEMLPFKRLTAAPYALNAGSLGGFTSTQFARLDQSNTFTTGSQLFQGSTSTTALQVQPSGGGTSVLDVDTANGRVGINNSAPAYPLDVTGAIRSSVGYYVGSTAGASATCTNGQLFQNQVANGGLLTGGSCVSLATISNGLFVQNGSAVNGVTCTSGQTLVFTAGAWTCGTASGGSSYANSAGTVIDPRVGNASAADTDTSTYASTVDATGTGASSIATGNDGFPRVAYATSNAIKFAQCTNISCSTANITTLESGITAYYPFSVALAVDSSGNANIAYSYGTGGSYGYAGYLKYVHCTNADCTSSTNNIVYNVSTGNKDVPTSVALALDSSGVARMSFGSYCSGNGSFNCGPFAAYAIYTYEKSVTCYNVNCSSSSISTIDSMTFSNQGGNYTFNGFERNSISVNSGGYVNIGYGISYTSSSVSHAETRFYGCNTTGSCSGSTILSSTGENNTASMAGSDGLARIAMSNGTFIRCTVYYCGTSTVTSVGALSGVASNMYVGPDGLARVVAGGSLVKCNNNDTCAAPTVTTITGGAGSNTSLTMAGGVPIISSNGGGLVVKLILKLPSTLGVSSKSSVAVGSDGFARVVYVDNVTQALKFIKCTNATCTTRSTQTVDSSGGGRYASLALDSSGLANISYYDAASSGLKFAHCTTATCSSVGINIVDSAGVGFYTSVAMGTDGYPRISYYDAVNGYLKFAQCTNIACTTKTLTTVDNTANVGIYTSLAVNSSDTYARISYYDITNAHLKYAQCTNAACSGPTITTVDSTSSVDTGTYGSLTLAADGFARISYYDATNSDLKFAQCINNACTTPTLTVVDSLNSVGSNTSIAMGTDGYARISYYDITNGDLKYASCTNAACTTNNLNNVDWDGNVGYDTSIAVNASGYASISYYDITYSYLKLWVEGSTQGAGSGSGGGTALSSITAALSDKNIDNTNFAISWNWSTATTQTALALSADALTTGNAFSVSSASPSLATAIASINSTNTTGTQANGLLINRVGSGGATTSLLNLMNTSGTVSYGLNFTGTFGNLINSSNFFVTNAGNLSALGLTSTVATGTAPLVVASTTKVTNLNADLLDGMDSSAFGDATVANQNTILARIGTTGDAAGVGSLFARLARIDDTDLGATADTASSSGTIFARLTDLFNRVSALAAVVGATNDAAGTSTTGSVNGKLNALITSVAGLSGGGSSKTLKTATFSANGTWTAPSDVSVVVSVYVVAGGGGGGAGGSGGGVCAQSQAAGGGGGGSGFATIRQNMAVTPSAGYSVVVGAAGAANGGAGGDSSILGVAARGGSGGSQGGSGATGASGCSFSSSGGNGGNGASGGGTGVGVGGGGSGGSYGNAGGGPAGTFGTGVGYLLELLPPGGGGGGSGSSGTPGLRGNGGVTNSYNLGGSSGASGIGGAGTGQTVTVPGAGGNGGGGAGGNGGSGGSGSAGAAGTVVVTYWSAF